MPTLGSEGETIGKQVQPEALAGLGLANIEFVSVGTEKSVGKGGLRREWRINPKTGDLRGIAYRYRGGKKGRANAYYIGKREKPDEFKKIYPQFEAWRRANRTLTSVGIISDRNPVRTG